MRRGRETAVFEYEQAWLDHEERFALEPALQLGPGPFHAGADKPLFGAIGDSAPDRWGRMLMRRAERRRVAAAGEAPRTLFEIDYLLRVNDEARMGALPRFIRGDQGLGGARTYDVAADGERFLVLRPPDNEAETSRPRFIVGQNWLDELERLMPTE